MISLLILFTITLILYQLYVTLTTDHNYWKKRNVPYLKPRLIFGNFMDYILLKKYAAIVTSEICDQFPDEPYVGVFYGTAPALVIKDPEILKLVLTKDFDYFNGRENTDYAYYETIKTNLFFNGGDHWKVLRQNLTPLFTSAKLKNMFPMIKECAEEMDTFLEEETKLSENINGRALFGKYAMECIINCVFGIRANTMKRDNNMNPFIIVGEQIFDTSTKASMKLIFQAMWPSLFHGLRLKFFDAKIGKFFNDLFVKTCENRSKDNILKNDFTDLILTWKKKDYITGNGFSKNEAKIKVNEELLLAQCTLFVAAGFETTAATTNFLLYELAKNKFAQNRLIDEVDAYFDKNCDIKWECLTQMPYLEACIDESLRLYPVLGNVTREVMNNYKLPSGLELRKGDRVHIPVYHIHRNPEYFPDPTSYLPERFFGDEKKKIKPHTFMPFGEGPRVCIGARFAKMVMYAAILTIFKKYTINLPENMPQNIKLRPAAISTEPAIDIYLRFMPR